MLPDGTCCGRRRHAYKSHEAWWLAWWSSCGGVYDVDKFNQIIFSPRIIIDSIISANCNLVVQSCGCGLCETSLPTRRWYSLFMYSIRATCLKHNNFTEMPAGSRTVRTSPRELVCQRMPPSTSKGQGFRGDRDPLCLPRRGTPTGRPQGNRGASGVQKKCHGDDHTVLINLR